MAKTLINILGAGRSGTTMLDLMLGNDVESFSMGEVYALFRPHRKHHFSIDCNCGDPECEYWVILEKCREDEMHLKAFDILGVNYLVDSSKYLPWVMDSSKWVRKNDNVRVVNILIYKPVISYIYSIYKRGESFEKALNSYKTYYKRFFQSGLDACAVSFDDLVHETDDTLKQLCVITGQQFHEKRKEFWNKEHHHLYGSAGTRKQVNTGESHIRTRDEFPAEFQSIYPKIQQLIQEDKILRNVEIKLKEIDFKKQSKDQSCSDLHIVKPKWYYISKLKNKWKSKFPD